MIIKFNNHTAVPSISPSVFFHKKMPLRTITQENNASSNDPHGSQIQVDNEDELWKENEVFATTLIPAMIFVGILMFVGCVGNTLVVYIFGFKFKSATQHSLIVCLACFDLLMSLIAMPSEIADMRFHHMFSSVFACKLLRFITMFSAVSSSLILVIIAVDRHRRVTKPLKRQMTVRNARILEVVGVCAALVFSWPSLVLTGLRSTETTIPGLIGRDCSFSDHFKDTKLPFAHNAVLGIGFIVVITVLAVLYFQIWKTAKIHMSHMFRRPKPTLSPTLSNAFKQNEGDFDNAIPNASNEIDEINGMNSDTKADIDDLKAVSFSLTSSRGMDFDDVFSEINIHNYEVFETNMIKEFDEQVWKDMPFEVNSDMSRNFEEESESLHKNNVFNFDFQSLVKSTVNGHFTGRLRAKSLDDTPSQKRITQCFTTCKLSSALSHSHSEIWLSKPLNGDLSLTSASLGKKQKCPLKEGDRNAKPLTSEKMKRSLYSASDFEQSTTNPEAQCLQDNSVTVSTNTMFQDDVLMYTQSCERNPDTKQIPTTGNDFKAGANISQPDVESDMKNGDISSCSQTDHTDISTKTFISVPMSTKCKCGQKRCSNLINSDISCSDSTNSTSLEELDLYSFDKPVRRKTSWERNLGGNCEMTQPQNYSLPDSCSKCCIDTPGQTDVAPLDEPCAGNVTHQLSSNQVPRLTLVDIVAAKRISHLISQRCQPMGTFPHIMSEDRVSLTGEISKIKCELNINETSPGEIQNPKNISLTRALPRLFDRKVANEARKINSKDCDLQLSQQPSVFSITNKQGSKYKQRSDGKQQRKVSTNSTTPSVKAIGRRPSRLNDKTTLVAFSISSVFVLSFLPYLVLMFTRAFLSNFDYSLQGASLCAYNIFVRFYLLNSAANPLLYGLLNERFRQECRTILCYFCSGNKDRVRN